MEGDSVSKSSVFALAGLVFVSPRMSDTVALALGGLMLVAMLIAMLLDD